MANFYTVLTETGQAKMANAIALGTTIEITALAVGDGGGVLPNPDSTRTTLVNETRRASINRVEVDADNPSWLIVEQVLPPDVGGWTIREVGIFDAAGDLIGYGNYPETYKPTLDQGSGRTLAIRMVLEVSHTSAVTLKVDPSVVLATRKYVDDSTKKYGLGSVAPGGPPVLNDFANANQPTGFYRAYGAGTPTPTPNVPPETGNAQLSVYALNIGYSVHWIVEENSATAAAGHRLFFGNTHNGGVIWNQVFHDGNVGDATETARGFTRYATLQEHRDGTRSDRAAKPSGVKAAIDSRIADQTTVDAGVDDTKFVTPLKLKGWVKQATETVLGWMKVATQAQVNAGTDDATAVTPKKLRFGVSYSLGDKGYVAFPSWMGGLIFQWAGWYKPTGSSEMVSVPLPITFPTVMYGVWSSARNNVFPLSQDPSGLSAVNLGLGGYWSNTANQGSGFVYAIGK